jgi:hypothetical protein
VLTGPGADDPATADLEACAEGTGCGPADITSTGYTPGHYEYSVSVADQTPALLNESYYDGWIVAACTSGGECVTVPAESSDSGLLSLELPAGDYTLVLDYETPGRAAGWVLFALGVLLSGGAPVLTWAARRRGRVDGSSERPA